MGMDLYVYKLATALSFEEAGAREDRDEYANLVGLAVTQAQLSALQNRFPGLEARPQVLVDIEKAMKLAGLDENWSADAWGFTEPTGWLNVLRYDPETEKTEEKRVEVPSDQVLVHTGLFDVRFEGEEVGYMRKPFRKRIECPVVQANAPGEAPVLSDGNFDGANMEKLVPLLGGNEVMERANVVFLPQDKLALEALKEHCHDPKGWQTIVLDELDADMVVNINW